MPNQRDVQEFLAAAIAEAMYMEPDQVPEHELFSNFGLESLTLVKLTTKINERFALNVNAKDVLRHQTLHDAASYVYTELQNQRACQEGV